MDVRVVLDEIASDDHERDAKKFFKRLSKEQREREQTSRGGSKRPEKTTVSTAHPHLVRVHLLF